MKKLLDWLSPSKKEPAPPVQVSPDDHLANQRVEQELRIELAARDARIQRLSQEVERLRERQESLLAESLTARLESLFGDMAGPASQVMTQADLLENQGKPVQAKDVLAVARRMVRALERHGLVLEGSIGQPVAFDPNRHTPISAETPLPAGTEVKVRFAGVSYQGKILHKAIVEEDTHARTVSG